MSEGSLEAPVRHQIPWREDSYYDEAALDAELRRVFDICHGCRLCFNLCDSFPTLFDLIDAAGDEELEGVDSRDFKKVIDGCTLCDMCFMTKCPYVPPHEFDLDFPHLMLRYRAVENRNGKSGFWNKQITKTERNNKMACSMAGLSNWATKRNNGLTRGAIQAITGIHKDAALPRFESQTLEMRAAAEPLDLNTTAPAYGRKAVVYATCYGNYNNTGIGDSLRRVLAKNGVDTDIVHHGCCGMPMMEQGDLKAVAEAAASIAAAFRPSIESGYSVIATISSCALMLKFEWPLLLPDNEDVRLLSENTFDAAQYVVDIARTEGLADGLHPLDGGVTLHVACHARAQNMGVKAAELLRLIPGTKPKVLSRCSGHGGSWGVMKENFEIGMKVGKPVVRDVVRAENRYIVSECPLASMHILQGMERIEGVDTPDQSLHPIELFAKAYGF